MTVSPRITSKILISVSLRRASSETRKMLLLMTAEATSLVLLAHHLNAQVKLAMSWKQDQWLALTYLVPLDFLELEEKMQPPLGKNSSILRAGGLDPRVLRLRSTLRSRRRTSGPPFRSSTPCFTMRSKSRLSCVTARERDSSRRSWTSSWRRSTRERMPRSRSDACTRTSRTSTSSCSRRRRSRRLLPSKSALCKRRSAVTNNFMMRSSAARSNKRRLTLKKLL